MPDEVRASFLRFPGWSQHFWTWFTGKALPHQEPLIRHTWFSYLAVTLLVFFAGLSLSTAAVAAKFSLWPLALLAGWVMTLAAARTMILVIAHQCIHKRFAGSSKLDNAIAELVTVLTVFHDAHTFKVEHFESHHRESIFATPADPPVQLLVRLGFRPGMSRAELWRRAAAVFVSPRFYLSGFWERLRCNLVTGSWRRLGFFAWAALWVLAPFWLTAGWQAPVLAFVVPVILLAQLSALLDKLGEHAWLTQRHPDRSSRYYHVDATWARFCGTTAPPRWLPLRKKLVAWPRWVVSMSFYHLPARLLVVVGDLPNHDFHHRHPGTRDWMIAAYARQRDVDEALDGAPPYTEVWGLGQAIDRMFQGFSEVPELGAVDASLGR